ncbi:hypothetical protein [Janibacter terrae]|uniref:hypothetical protein n=1 Tax=Janibacter terrae TaxID=103817 RepID=UPI0031F89731
MCSPVAEGVALTAPEVLIPALAGLIGAIIGGGASWLAAKSQIKAAAGQASEDRRAAAAIADDDRQAAQRLIREERVIDAVSALWGLTWPIVGAQPKRGQVGRNLVPDFLAFGGEVFRTAGLVEPTDPALSRILFQYGNSLQAEETAADFIHRARVVSSALQLWLKDPVEFRRRDWHLQDYGAELDADIEAVEREQNR